MRKASMWKGSEDCGMGWNTLALWVGLHFIYSFFRFSFIVAWSLIGLFLTPVRLKTTIAAQIWD